MPIKAYNRSYKEHMPKKEVKFLSRPRKQKKVCNMPENSQFGPLSFPDNLKDPIFMTIDEFESIRLIDLENYSQEACAEQMRVARSTIQRTYNDAKKKIAISLVEGRVLRIEGGDFKLCDSSDRLFGCGKCRKLKLIVQIKADKEKEEIPFFLIK